MTAMKRGPAARSCSQRSAPSRTTSFRSSPQDSRRRSRTSWSASCRQRFGCCRISRSPHDPELLTEAPTLDEVDGKQVNVYTVNPDAVWSDGTPITAADFAFTAKVQDAEFVEACPDGGVVGSIGYDQIESINGSDDGKTVTVTYGTPRYADWQALFTLLPAHLLDSEDDAELCATVTAGWPTGQGLPDDISGGPWRLEAKNIDVPSQLVTLTPNELLGSNSG